MALQAAVLGARIDEALYEAAGYIRDGRMDDLYRDLFFLIVRYYPHDTVTISLMRPTLPTTTKPVNAFFKIIRRLCDTRRNNFLMTTHNNIVNFYQGARIEYDTYDNLLRNISHNMVKRRAQDACRDAYRACISIPERTHGSRLDVHNMSIVSICETMRLYRTYRRAYVHTSQSSKPEIPDAVSNLCDYMMRDRTSDDAIFALYVMILLETRYEIRHYYDEGHCTQCHTSIHDIRENNPIEEEVSFLVYEDMFDDDVVERPKRSPKKRTTRPPTKVRRSERLRAIHLRRSKRLKTK